MEKIICQGEIVTRKTLGLFMGKTDKEIEKFLERYKEESGSFEYNDFVFYVYADVKKRKRHVNLEIDNAVPFKKMLPKNTFFTYYIMDGIKHKTKEAASMLNVSYSYFSSKVYGLETFTIKGKDVKAIRELKKNVVYTVKDSKGNLTEYYSANSVYKNTSITTSSLKKHVENGRFVYFKDGLSVKLEEGVL